MGFLLYQSKNLVYDLQQFSMHLKFYTVCNSPHKLLSSFFTN